ncbi:MAG: N-formylglutamate amidohydrolase, partial [Alphaproteobacteria bacterium]|nr:N-formylglutamate amidohydrolase [Alphaproteobacteria bacterium]
EIAISWCDDVPSAAAALAVLRNVAGLTVGDNTPYALDHGEDFTTPEHAVRCGLRHIQVEFRQDLVAERNGAEAWAERFAPALEAALNL